MSEAEIINSHETRSTDTPKKNTVKSSQDFSYKALDNVRKKLIDLTARNKFLNFRHSNSNCIRFIDSGLDQICSCLKQGQRIYLDFICEPTEEQLVDAGYLEPENTRSEDSRIVYPKAVEWAKYLKIPTQYELSVSNTTNNEQPNSKFYLKSLWFAHELESRARKLKGNATTKFEETGVNVLYLALGFLEWFESRDSDISRLAPLYVLPVYLNVDRQDKKEGVYRYYISIADDPLISNLALKEKLERDFKLALPEIDEDLTCKDYLEMIQNIILKRQPRWKIKNLATLSTLDFSKLVIYKELDPENWPKSKKIDSHPLIQKFFSSQDEQAQSNGLIYCEEYNIDEVEQIHINYPLIFDADSSQHNAIIDAVNGENIVIKGPPGTRKSQTITNIIAACISRGKSVLFVAEKMAALSVVKDRLDSAGLGDFCIELHSHKANKQQVVTELGTRINNQNSYKSPQTIDLEISKLEEYKDREWDGKFD